MRLSDKHKQMLRWAGYPLLALVTFVFAAHCTFPYERVKDRYIVEALSDKYDVSVMSVERSFLPGGMILRSVALRTRPTRPEEKPTTLFFDQIRVDLGLFAMLRGKVSVDIEAAIGGGTIEGSVEASKSEVKVSFNTAALPLATLPGVREAVGLPMAGGLHADIDMILPQGRWDRAEGKISLGCPGCTIGDGETKIKPRAPPGGRMNMQMAAFAGDGLTVPRLNLGNLSASIKIANGRGVVEDFKASSADGELDLQAVLRFGRQLKEASFESGCMKFKLTEALKQREPSFGNLPEFMRMSPQADGYSNVRLQGKLVTMRWVPAQTCEGGADDDRVSRRNARPSIPTTHQPEVPGLEPRPGIELPVDPPADEPMIVPPPRDEVEPDSPMPEPRTSGPPIAPDRPHRGDDVRLDEPVDIVKPELDEDRREEEERVQEERRRERRRDERRREERRGYDDDDDDDRGAESPRQQYDEPYER
jgi:type II secretion system protein N